MMQLAEQGKIELGGCMVDEDAPRRSCRQCGHHPGYPMAWDGIDGPRSGEFAHQHRVLRSAEVPPADASEPELLEFALSFDGYKAFGFDDLAALSKRARTTFEKRGSIPDNLVALRGCLFFEQRIARANNGTLHTPYVAALLEAIRAESRTLEV